MKRILMLTTVIMVLGMNAGVRAKDLGKYGATYPVVEQDAIAQLKKAIAGYDWEKFKRKQKGKNQKLHAERSGGFAGSRGEQGIPC